MNGRRVVSCLSLAVMNEGTSVTTIEGLGTPAQQARVPHAWKAGEQTQQLRQMLQALPDGGVVAMTVPKVPYRCPPGPYERASLIAHFLQTRKPGAKLLVFDANPEIQAKKGLFEAVWKGRYGAQIEYVPNADLKAVDTQSGTLSFDLQGKVKAQVINVIPPQRAGAIARNSGLANVGDRWCGVDFLSYESTAAKGVYVLGDSIAGAPGMPKSAHMANQHAKVCAAAVVDLLNGRAPEARPMLRRWIGMAQDAANRPGDAIATWLALNVEQTAQAGPPPAPAPAPTPG